MAELYRGDPAFAIEFLDGILQDGHPGELRIALRQMTKAFPPSECDSPILSRKI